MNRPQGRKSVFGVAALVLTSLLAACSTDHSDDRTTFELQPDKSATVPFGEVTIQVAPGTVAKRTALSIKHPDAKTPAPQLLNSNSVQFDLSLAGDVQPAKALDITIPLKGGYLPAGANPAHALLYTENDRGGWEIVPATVENGALRARLTHLSKKVIAYPDDQALLDLMGIQPVVESKPDCKTAVDTADGKAWIAAAEGWSDKPDSPLQACLSVKDKQAQLALTNRVNFIMAVASTDGVKVSNVGSAEERMIAGFAKNLFPNKATKAYIGRNATMNVPLPASSFPVTVQLQANPSSFLTEGAWSAVKFLIGLWSGQNDAGKLAKAAGTISSIPEVIDCIKSNLQFATNPSPSLNDVVNVVTDKCKEIILKKLGSIFTDDRNEWDKFIGRFGVVLGGAGTIWNTFWTTIDGIKMTFVGDLTVWVKLTRPKPKLSDCPSNDEFVKVASRQGTVDAPTRVAPGTKLCDSGWAYGRIQWYLPDDFGGWSDSVNAVLKQQSGKWVVHKIGGTDQLDGAVCSPMPRKIRDAACW